MKRRGAEDRAEPGDEQRATERRSESGSGAETENRKPKTAPRPRGYTLELRSAGAGATVVRCVRELCRRGLGAVEACSLLAHAAATLGRGARGLERSEWLALCAELYDRGDVTGEGVTSPGGAS